MIGGWSTVMAPQQCSQRLFEQQQWQIEIDFMHMREYVAIHTKQGFKTLFFSAQFGEPFSLKKTANALRIERFRKKDRKRTKTNRSSERYN